MIINVLKDLKIFDAGSKTGVEDILGKISINSNVVTLNLSRCIIDYPATSRIIDKILTEIQKYSKGKALIIQTHLNIIESLLIHWLFIGSEFLTIDDSKKKIDIGDLISIINQNLKHHQTRIAVQVINKAGIIIKEYKYGY